MVLLICYQIVYVFNPNITFYILQIDLVPCRVCGRKFAKDRIDRHKVGAVNILVRTGTVALSFPVDETWCHSIGRH
jgi:hypothetical protein